MTPTLLHPQVCRWHVLPSAAELEETVLTAILEAANQAIAVRGAFHLVLAGGSTPQSVYVALRGAEADWGAWHVYFGDERCLPPEHPDRNSRMAMTALLAHVPIPYSQMHIIPAEEGAEAAARAYSNLLKAVPEFDLVLLGLGEDGHTASLFPQQEWERAIAWPSVLPVHDAPKPPPDRVSLSPERLSQTRQVMFLVSGAGKARAVSDWREGVAIPASCIRPPDGVDVYLDQAAASSSEAS